MIATDRSSFPVREFSVCSHTKHTVSDQTTRRPHILWSIYGHSFGDLSSRLPGLPGYDLNCRSRSVHTYTRRGCINYNSPKWTVIALLIRSSCSSSVTSHHRRLWVARPPRHIIWGFSRTWVPSAALFIATDMNTTKPRYLSPLDGWCSSPLKNWRRGNDYQWCQRPSGELTPSLT